MAIDLNQEWTNADLSALMGSVADDRDWRLEVDKQGIAALRDKTAFQTSAVGNFGSGWTWLVKKADGSVDIVNMGAAGTPLTTSDRALLCIDVWEHAYYIDYRNMRPKFVETFLNNLVNWKFAEANFA